MFENLRWWSTRTDIQKQTSFFSEQAFYYRYFKKSVDSSSLSQILTLFTSDRRVQYPDTLNPLQHFNVYPELLLSLLYRLLPLNTPPIDYYIHSLHLLNGLYLGALFLTSTALSGLLGGLLSISAAFFNYTQLTRSWFSLPLRESWAMPFLMLQIALLTHFLRRNEIQHFQGALHLSALSLLTLLFLLSWQFGPFAVFTQVLSLYCTYLFGYMRRGVYVKCLGPVLVGGCCAVLLEFGNGMLLNSLMFHSVLVTSVMAYFLPNREVIQQKGRSLVSHLLALLWNGTLLVLTVALIVGEKLLVSKVFGLSDDGHIFDILRAKFTNYETMHTTLYLKQIEYQFIDQGTINDLTTTYLLPILGFVMVVMLFKVLFRAKLQSTEVYHWFQCLFMGLLTILIMRLKVFGVPCACLMISLLCNTDFIDTCEQILTKLRVPTSKTHIVYGLVLILLMGLMAQPGIANIKASLQDEKEWDHQPLQAYMKWIVANTPRDAVFSGDMVTMSYVMLCTDRIVTNHPHYETEEIRNRTALVYSIYTCKSPEEVYNILVKLGSDYVDVSPGGCVKSEVFGADCDQKHKFCNTVQNSPYFTPVFQNSNYRLFKINK
uniref:Uncharacterized protein n=1 Tax=Arcella intermedia TaxID=1963864 RepID=A0A6B2KZY4_9EUKA